MTTITIEREEDKISKYGRPCGRVMFKATDTDGKERGFAWAEQNWSDANLWTTYRWSDNVGPVILRSLLSRDEAIAYTKKHVEGSI